MTLEQNIIILVVFISTIIISLSATFSKREKIKNNLIYAQFFITIFCLIALIFATVTMNDLSQKSKGKCPEYEKVENVYKFKE